MVLPLPAEILLQILAYTDAKGVLNFRKTCKTFYRLSKSHSVWYSLLRRFVLEEDVPLPGLAGRSLESLEGHGLESIHLNALRLRRNWHSSHPVIKQSTRLISPFTHIHQIKVLTGRNGRKFLLALGLIPNAPNYYIQCWYVRQASLVFVAQRQCNQLFRGMAINKTGAETECIATMTTSSIEIISLVWNATNHSDAFVTSRTISIPVEITFLCYFQDRRMIVMDNRGRFFLLDIDHPMINIQFQFSEIPIDVYLTNTFVLFLNRKTLELYPLPPTVADIRGHIIIAPIFVYQWSQPVYSGVMTSRRSSLGISGTINPPIMMSVRFGDLNLPWGNNAVHQYEILPNPYFIPSELPSEMNVPYKYPPVQIGQIAAPIRLAAPTALVLGDYGTTIWLDSHTESYYQAPVGQRIAGAYAKRISDDESDERSDDTAAREASFVFAHQRAQHWSNIALDEEEGVIFLGCSGGSGTIDVFKYI